MNALAVAFQDNLAPGNDWLLGEQTPANRKERRAREAHDRKGERRRTASHARGLAREIGTSVWSATDLDDLADVLNASLDDPNIAQSAVKVCGALFRRELGELTGLPSFARAIHAKTTDNLLPDLLEGMRIVSIISGNVQKAQRASQASKPSTDPWTALVPYSLPAPMLESVLAGIRSWICLAALVDLGLSDRRPPAWLVRKVVRAWVDGSRTFLRTQAMIHGDEDVPEDLLPKALRLDQAQMIQEHNQGEIIFEQFIAGAIAAQQE